MRFDKLNLANNHMAALKAAKRVLCAQFPVEEVHLFGSFARGNGSEDSDLDLFVLTTRSVTYRDKAAM